MMDEPSRSAPPTPSTRLRERQAYYAERYGIATYTVDALALMAEGVDFEGARVLEFGGWNIPTEITLDDLGARSWTSVDMIGSISGSYQERRFQHLKGIEILDFEEGARRLGQQDFIVVDGDATLLPAPYFGKFDLVVTFATIEHVLDMVSFLDKAWHALVPGGVLAARFGPIWPCFVGHHAFVSPQINFQKPDWPIGPWGHLLMRAPEMLGHLRREGVGEADAALTVQQIYTSPRINRYSTEDYRGFFAASPFAATEFKPAWSKPPPPEIEARLRAAHPGIEDFATGGWQTLSRKAET